MLFRSRTRRAPVFTGGGVQAAQKGGGLFTWEVLDEGVFTLSQKAGQMDRMDTDRVSVR